MNKGYKNLINDLFNNRLASKLLSEITEIIHYDSYLTIYLNVL